MLLLLLLAAVIALWSWWPDPMLLVQSRRHLHVALCYLASLRQPHVTLHDFQAGVDAAYAAHAFARPLRPPELLQLALCAGFPPAAAAALARSQAAAPQAEADTAAGLARRRRQQRGSSAAPAAVPAWRYNYFMWWLQKQLCTLDLIRDEWEQLEPTLVCGFDVTRASANALLFRRPKGTFVVRLGSEVGGVVVSLRPDKACLPEEPRTAASYFGSVTPAQLAGGAYQLAEQPWAPERRALREGAVIHAYVPDSSLRLRGGLWACLRRMRHTKAILDVSVGQLVPSAEAFMRPPPRPTPDQLNAWRDQLLRERRGAAAADEALAGSAKHNAAQGE